MKLKTLLILLAMLILLVIGGFSGLAYVSLGELGTSLTANTDAASKYARLLNDTRAAQVAFQLQVQEWKDVLIRGNDKELYDKYWKAFEAQEKKMDEQLVSIREEMVALKLNENGVDKLLEAHADLGKKYREAILTWVPENMATGQEVDKLVRGMDRTTSGALTDLSNNIESAATEALKSAGIRATEDAANALSTFFIIAGVSGVLTLVFCYLIGRSVFKKVGAEPAELVEIFSHIAKGDLSRPVAVADGDETSLAASAALMQMRVKSMVRSIHNGARELNDAADEASLSSSMEDVKSALRTAKSSVRGLSDAAGRFKV